jgi:hypothetical protein
MRVPLGFPDLNLSPDVPLPVAIVERGLASEPMQFTSEFQDWLGSREGRLWLAWFSTQPEQQFRFWAWLASDQGVVWLRAVGTEPVLDLAHSLIQAREDRSRYVPSGGGGRAVKGSIGHDRFNVKTVRPSAWVARSAAVFNAQRPLACGSWAGLAALADRAPAQL